MARSILGSIQLGKAFLLYRYGRYMPCPLKKSGFKLPSTPKFLKWPKWAKNELFFLRSTWLEFDWDRFIATPRPFLQNFKALGRRIRKLLPCSIFQVLDKPEILGHFGPDYIPILGSFYWPSSLKLHMDDLRVDLNQFQSNLSQFRPLEQKFIISCSFSLYQELWGVRKLKCSYLSSH